MSDSEPSWASDTAIDSRQVLYNYIDVLKPELHRLPDLNKTSISAAPIVYLCQLTDATAVFSADNVAKIFVSGKFLNQFHFSSRPHSVTLWGYMLLLFFRSDLIQLDLVNGTYRTVSNPFGRVTYAKYVAENKLVICNFKNISYVDATYMRSIRDMRSRINCELYCSNSKYAICGFGQQLQIFSIYYGKSFVCDTSGQVSCLEVFYDYVFVGEKSGIVCLYYIDELSFDTHKLKLVRQFKNLSEPVRTISVQPSGSYCFIQAGSEFRLISLDKMECCYLSYFKIVCHCCSWKGNEMLLGKPDGRVWRISLGY